MSSAAATYSNAGDAVIADAHCANVPVNAASCGDRANADEVNSVAPVDDSIVPADTMMFPGIKSATQRG